jgi:L-alanine-DL-glutamate epimerase-like enolase superfamily enzyme
VVLDPDNHVNEHNPFQHRPDQDRMVRDGIVLPAARHADQRCQGADRPPEADDRDRDAVRRDRDQDGTAASASVTRKRAGGPGQFAHAKEIAPALIGEDPSDIARLWTKLCWAGASVGRSGMASQAIGAFDVALYDLKAARAGLSLSKLLGSQRDSVQCYNTSGGFLHTPLEQLLVNASASRERGIGGIKLKVGQPDRKLDIQRVEAVASTWATTRR